MTQKNNRLLKSFFIWESPERIIVIMKNIINKQLAEDVKARC